MLSENFDIFGEVAAARDGTIFERDELPIRAVTFVTECVGQTVCAGR